MKKYPLLVALFLFALAGSAQTSSKTPKDNPRTRLAETRKELRAALKAEDSPRIIRLLTLEMRDLCRIDRDSFNPLLQRLEKFVARNNRVVENCMLHSILAELYQGVYRREARRFNAHALILDTVPDNIDTWSGNIFLDKVFFHLQASLAHPEELQRVNSRKYKAILLQDEDFPEYYPSMFGLLTYRAIDILTSCKSYISRFVPQVPLTDSTLLEPAADFLQRTWKANNPKELDPLILQHYQNLLREQTERKRHSLLVYDDLKRLAFLRKYLQSPVKDSLYAQALDHLYRKYKNTPAVLEVILALADYYNTRPFSTPAIWLQHHQKVLALCEEGIRRFPKHKRVNHLINLKEKLKAPECHLYISKNVYPGRSHSLQVLYRNLSSLEVSLHHSRTQVARKTYMLPKSILLQDTSFQIFIPEAKWYHLVARAQGDKQAKRDTLRVMASRLFSSVRATSERDYDVLVCDWVTGAPVEGAKVTLLANRPAARRVPISTDKNGLVSIKQVDKQYTSARVYYDGDYFGQILPLWEGDSPSEEVRQEVQLFTDRVLYRPGQTVHFKGIAWRIEHGERKVLPGKQFEIVLESSQGKEIGRQQLTTNAFGSFCGTFVLPREVLNGRFYLRVPSETRKIIRVEAYKRPKFEIVFHPVDYTYRLGDSITLTGEVKNYSGFPLANTKMAYRIQAEAWKYKQLVDQGELQTDETGRFRILVPTERVAGHASLAYNVQMTFTAPNGETQEHSYSLPVQNDAFYLGLRLKAIVNKAKPAQFPFSAFNAQHLPVRQTVRYKIERLKTPEQLVSGHIYPAQFTEKEVQACILQGQFTTGDSLLELDLSAYPSGIYLFTVQGASPRDSLIRRRNVFTLYSPGDARPPYPTYSWFVEEKTTFAPGEPAKLLLGTSAQVVNVLYEIYANNQFVHRERFTLSDENRILQIPYQAHYGSNAEVILTYVKDQQFFVHTATLERKKEESSLRLFTRTFRDRLQPGQRETWSLTLQKANGEAVFGEVMAGMYDASLDQLYMPNRWELYSFRSSFNRIPRWFHPRKSEEYQRSHFPIFNKLPVYPIRTQWDDFRLQRRLDFYFGEGTTFTAAAVRIPSSKSMATDEDEMYCLNERAFAVEGMADRAPAERTTGIRKNFQETAFFYPQLLTDEAGEVRFSFTMPDVNTTWRFMSLAHTPELQQGRLEKMVVTSKPFMISPQLPRFVRMDDQVTLQATLQNLSMETQTGTVYFELFDPYTEKVTHREQLPFHAPAKGAETVRFSFTVPKGETLLGCRFVARSRQFSDGEQHVLPVAPNTVLVTRTLPLFLTKPGQESFTLSAPKWATPYRFTLELTANPTWYAVLALPSLSTPQSEHGTDQLAAYYVSHLAQAIVTANPQISDLIRYGLAQSEASPVSPLSQNEELKSTLLQLTPWAMEAENETAQLQALGELLDTNRQTYLQQQALQKLQALQNADGGWSWFKGCSSSRFITFNVLEMFSRLTVTAHITLPVEVKGMQQRALRYIDEEIRADFERNTAGGYLQLLYLHTRSAYSDTLTGETKKVYDYYFKLFEAHWPELSLYEKALLAVVCHRSGKKETAQAILQSLREYATTTAAEGMFWANNRSRFYTYSTLQTHTAILNAFYEIEGSSEKIRRMKQWLLRQKQTHMWESVPVTVEAIFALMRTGETTLNTPDSCTVRVNRKRLAPSRMLPSLGYFKQGYMGKALPTRAPRVTIRKTTDQLSWGGLYLQYFEHLDSIRQHTGGLSVEKQLFVEREGNFFPLHTSQGQRNLKVGDKVNIRLVVTAPEAMQFVHLKDLRAGCFEPTNQLSGNRWQGSVLYYQETDDTVTNLFFEYLPKGTHVFEYTVWITQSGDYQDGIATLQCIYAPQFSANSQAGRIKVE